MRSKGLILFSSLLLFSSILVLGQGDALKKRFLERKPQITSMKDQGTVGENNGGFLEFRTPNPTDRQRGILDAENADRTTVYRGIARKLGTSVEAVGKRRAVQIAKQAKPGHWLQDPEGNWYRKK